MMNTSELVKILAENRGMTQAETRRLLDTVIDTFNNNLASGNTFTIPSLGTFKTKVREERESYNPHYEQYMKLPPKRIVVFNPSKGLKEGLKQVE